MRKGECPRLAVAALLGSAITLAYQSLLPEEPQTAKAAASDECVCSCRAEVDLQSESQVLLAQGFEYRSHEKSRASVPRASQRASSLLQASTAAANALVIPTEGPNMPYGTLQHNRSLLSSSMKQTKTALIAKDPDDGKADGDESAWFNWLHEKLKGNDDKADGDEYNNESQHDNETEHNNETEDNNESKHKKESDYIIRSKHKTLEVHRSTSTDFLEAGTWLCLITFIPVAFFLMYGKDSTWTNAWQSVALLLWLIGGFLIFCYVIEFESIHWEGQRTLSLVETVYLIAQVITTVGFGDMTPAYRSGQIAMGIFLIFALILMTNMASKIGGIRLQHVEDLSQQLRQQVLAEACNKAVLSSSSLELSSFKRTPSQWPEWIDRTYHLTQMESKLGKTLLLFLGLCVVGVLFFHHSEEKSWLEAVYMVIVTSTSLGFGVCTPKTRQGFAFSAFWMVFACGSLGLVIGNFSHLMLMMERSEHMNALKRRIAFRASCKLVRKQENDRRVNRYEFTRLMILYADMVQESDLVCLERLFDHLHPDEEGLIAIDSIEQSCFDD